MVAGEEELAQRSSCQCNTEKKKIQTDVYKATNDCSLLVTMRTIYEFYYCNRLCTSSVQLQGSMGVCLQYNPFILDLLRSHTHYFYASA